MVSFSQSPVSYRAVPAESDTGELTPVSLRSLEKRKHSKLLLRITICTFLLVTVAFLASLPHLQSATLVPSVRSTSVIEWSRSLDKWGPKLGPIKQPPAKSRGPLLASPPLSIDDLLLKAAINETIVLTFASYAWRKMVLNLRTSLIRVGRPNLCVATADKRLFDLLVKEPPLDGAPVCVFEASQLQEVDHQADWQTGDDKPFEWLGKEFNDLQILKYQISARALRLGLSVFVMDTDITVMKDFFPIFENYYSHCGLTVYCCGNIGLMYLPALHANASAAFLDEFMGTLYSNNEIQEGKWDQMEFPEMAKERNLFCLADEHFRYPEQDGCFRWFTNMTNIAQDSYIFHATCVFGKSMYLKIRIYKQLHIWFSDEHEYEETKDQFLTYENPALYDLDTFNAYKLDKEYEAREFASALGIAIALDRTLITPHFRCLEGGVDIIDSYCPLVWPHRAPGPDQPSPYVRNYIDEYVNKRVNDTWHTSELVAEYLDAVEEKFGVRVHDVTYLTDPRTNPLRVAEPPSILDLKFDPPQATPLLRSPLTVPKLLDREVESQNVTHSVICGDDVMRVFSQYLDWPLLRLATASSSSFGGFRKGTPQDVKWRGVLKELKLSSLYRTCPQV